MTGLLSFIGSKHRGQSGPVDAPWRPHTGLLGIVSFIAVPAIHRPSLVSNFIQTPLSQRAHPSDQATIGEGLEMTTNLLNNPQHWRERAKDARWLVEQVTGPESKRVMLGIAERYEGIAQRAESRLLESEKSK
jgi:hypothetical protein